MGFLFIILPILAIIWIIQLIVKISYILTLVITLPLAIIGFVYWRKNKETQPKRSSAALAFSIVFIVIFVIVGVSPFISDWYDKKDYVDTGVYAEETHMDILHFRQMTLNGVTYYEVNAPYSFLYDIKYNDETFTPIANVQDCDDDVIYSVANDAGVTILSFKGYSFLTHSDLSTANNYYKRSSDYLCI